MGTRKVGKTFLKTYFTEVNINTSDNFRDFIILEDFTAPTISQAFSTQKIYNSC